jgi:hypothetical protein
VVTVQFITNFSMTSSYESRKSRREPAEETASRVQDRGRPEGEDKETSTKRRR